MVLVDRWRHRWLPRTGLAAELFEVARRFDELRGELEPHLAEEERVVFPLIRHLVTSDTAPLLLRRSRGHPLARLLAEHDRIGELFVDLRWLTDAYQAPPDGCASYQACYAGLAELEADTPACAQEEQRVVSGCGAPGRTTRRGPDVTGAQDEGGDPAC